MNNNVLEDLEHTDNERNNQNDVMNEPGDNGSNHVLENLEHIDNDSNNEDDGINDDNDNSIVNTAEDLGPKFLISSVVLDCPIF